MAPNDKWKIWVFRQIANNCDCGSFNFIDFNIPAWEPTELTQEEYNDFVAGLRAIPYQSQNFVYLIHPPDGANVTESVTTHNIIQKSIAAAKKQKEAEAKKKEALSERAKKTAAEKLRKKDELEKAKFEELKKKYGSMST